MIFSTTPRNAPLVIAVTFLAAVVLTCQAWVPSSTTPFSTCLQRLTIDRRSAGAPQYRHINSFPGLASTPSPSVSVTSMQEESKEIVEADDEEYEYIEYDILTEAEFLGSEWLVGTANIQNLEDVKETWVRLIANKDGKNVAIWGDKAQGTWAFDVASQFVSISKENLFGKNIWACVADDYYYLQGTVRGWSFVSTASVNGQWQARRLGVDPDEAGIAPWFEKKAEDEVKSNESDLSKAE